MLISRDTHRKDLKQPLVPAEGYPYRNTLILDMPGEIWKPIPDYEDYYAISNMGRVKSLERMVPVNFCPSRYHLLPEKILSQTQNKNKGCNTLFVQLTVDNFRKSYMTKALVYTLFVEAVDLKTYRIIHLDGIGENCRAENLGKIHRIQKDRKAAALHEKRIKSGWSDTRPYQNLSIEDMPGEVWKPFYGYEEYYMVSNLGRIKSLPRPMKRKLQNETIHYHTEEAIRCQRLDNRYRTPHLSFAANINRRRREYLVADIVYSSFTAPIEDGCHAFHIDGNSLNNRVENLAVKSKTADDFEYRAE